MSGIEVPGLTLPEARTPSPSGQQFGDSVYQRLLQDRIIFMGTQVADEMANAICAQILLLAADDPEKAYSFTSTLQVAQSAPVWRSTTPCSS